MRMNMRGLTMVETMMTIGIVGIIIAGIATLGRQSITTMGKQSLISEADEIRLALMERVNCDMTLDPQGGGVGACDALGPAMLRDPAGQIVVNKPMTAFGKGFQVRATCVDPDGGGPKIREIYTEYQRLTPAGAPAKDPLTGDPLTWRSLFDPGISLCPGAMPKRWEQRYADLNMDLIQLASMAIWIFQNLTMGFSNMPVLVGGDSYPPIWYVETTGLFYGAARCPRGYTAVGGSVDCGNEPAGQETIDPAPATGSTFMVRRGGYKLMSGPAHNLSLGEVFYANPADRNFKGVDYWYAGCGVALENFIVGSFSASLTAKRVAVNCYRNRDF